MGCLYEGRVTLLHSKHPSSRDIILQMGTGQPHLYLLLDVSREWPWARLSSSFGCLHSCGAIPGKLPVSHGQGLYRGKLPCLLVLWGTLGNVPELWSYRDIFTLLRAILGKMFLLDPVGNMQAYELSRTSCLTWANPMATVPPLVID